MVVEARAGMAFDLLDPEGTKHITWAASHARRASDPRGQHMAGRTGFWHGRRVIQEPNALSERFRDLLDSGAIARVAPGPDDWLAGQSADAYAGTHADHILETILLVTETTGRKEVPLWWDHADGRRLMMIVTVRSTLSPYEPWEATEIWHEIDEAQLASGVPDEVTSPRSGSWIELYADSSGLRDHGSTAALAHLWSAAVGVGTASYADIRFVPSRRDTVPPDCGMILFPLEDATGVVTGVVRHWIPCPEEVGSATPRPELRQGHGVFRVLNADGTGGPAPYPVRNPKVPLAITVCDHPIDALVLVDSGPAWKGQATVALCGHPMPDWLRAELATCRVTFARVPSAHVEVVAAAEASFREEGIAVTRLVPPGNATTFAEARLAEWVSGYRPEAWPPPDPHGEVPGEPPVSRLPADWWVPVAIATDQPITEVIPEAASAGG